MKLTDSSVFKNFIYLFVNQFSNLIIPLLVFPFLIKTLGLKDYGLYSWTYSWVIFCFMLCDYGFNFSGSKYIAVNKDNIIKRDVAFSTILSIRIVLAVAISLLWIIFVLCNPVYESHIFFGITFIGMIIGNAINLQWFFQGLEQLGWFSTINSFIKLLSNISILFVIRSADDLYLLPVIYSFAYLLTGLLTVLIAMYSVKVQVQWLSFNGFKDFLIEGWHYFITISTTSLIFNGTIIILGFFEKSILIIGAFSALDRIIKILVSIYIPYSTAIYPRNMANFNISEEKGIKSVIKYGSIALVCSIICVIIVCSFSSVILSFLDPQLVAYSNWLRVLSVWLFFIVINNLIGYHFMNGLNKSRLFRNINITYTIITVTLMITGCYLYSFKGCILAVVFGELLLTAMLVYNNRPYLAKNFIISGN
jgi:PST family polysaccharide transporter